MSPTPDSDYSLLDSGHGQKLESFAGRVLVRPSPQALWSPRLDAEAWAKADAHYERSRRGGGRWKPAPGRPLPDAWPCAVGPLRLQLKPTGFGHVGVFPEQIPFWRWIHARCAEETTRRGSERPVELLNLFAYTGGSSLAAALGGAQVTHCDASRGVVQWASENARLNQLEDHPIRWIVDDAVKFLRREARRDRRYQAVVLDPPSFGRGPKGEVWKLEESAGELLEAVCAVLDEEDPAFVLLSAHTPGLGAWALRHLLAQALENRFATGPHSTAVRDAARFGHGEMLVPASDSVLPLPSGTWSTWSARGAAPDPLESGSPRP